MVPITKALIRKLTSEFVANLYVKRIKKVARYTRGFRPLVKEYTTYSKTKTGIVSSREINRLKKISERLDVLEKTKIPVGRRLAQIAQNIGLRAKKFSTTYIFAKRLKEKGFTYNTVAINNWDFGLDLEFYQLNREDILIYNAIDKKSTLTTQERAHIQALSLKWKSFKPFI